jgi:hypothetical protein
MTSAASPRTYGRSRPPLDPKRMQRNQRKARSPSSGPCISQCSCREEPPPGLMTVAEEDGQMKEDETMLIVADLMSIEEMDMTDVVEVSCIKIRYNKSPHRHSRCSQLRETFASGWAIHRRKVYVI